MTPDDFASFLNLRLKLIKNIHAGADEEKTDVTQISALRFEGTQFDH